MRLRLTRVWRGSLQTFDRKLGKRWFQWTSHLFVFLNCVCRPPWMRVEWVRQRNAGPFSSSSSFGWFCPWSGLLSLGSRMCPPCDHVSGRGKGEDRATRTPSGSSQRRLGQPRAPEASLVEHARSQRGLASLRVWQSRSTHRARRVVNLHSSISKFGLCHCLVPRLTRFRWPFAHLQITIGHNPGGPYNRTASPVLGELGGLENTRLEKGFLVLKTK